MFLLLPLLFVSPFVTPANSAEGSGGKIGDLPPPLAVVAPGGESLNLEIHKGKPVILGFWQGHCLPCLVELPRLGELHQKHDELGVILINVGGDPAMIEEAAKNSPFTLVSDPLSLASKTMGVGAYPTFFVLNKQGAIAARIAGPGQEAVLVREVESLFQ
ncbi:hypothetical protein FACS1894205_0340 [Alphaproteobacteria bacterium]|nr:hypothetical protein FACS1894205_0340 [Alphaproteobacteria bacterium]